MRRIRFLQLFLLLLAVQLAVAQNALQRYEYWIDNDYDSRTVVQTSEEDITFTMDVSHLSPGIYYINVRGQAASGQWGALARYMVYLTESGTNAESPVDYEYWLDNDYEHRELVEAGYVPDAITVDVSTVAPGLHYFNFRAKSSGGQWGGLSRFLVYIVESGKDSEAMAGYEYWIDNNYQGRKQELGSHVPSAITIDASTLYPGIHYFNFRAKSLSGQWGGLTRFLFFIPQPETKLKNIEYWLDENFEDRLVQEVTDSTVVIEMNLEDLKFGEHSFNFIGQTTDGSWCLPACYTFSLDPLPPVPTPKIAHEGNTITISDADSVSHEYPITYHYTLDGTMPTRHSTPYEGPFDVVRNDTLRVVGVQTAHEYSEVAELIIDWFKVADPEFVQVGNTLTITTDTARAAIYYRIGDGVEQLYEAPIRLADQRRVTAVGRLDGFKDSETKTWQPRTVQTAKPVIAYNGRYLEIRKNDANEKDEVSIYYTLDGASPYEGLDVAQGATAYNSSLTIDSLCRVRVVAVVDTLNVSDEASYSVDYLYNDEANTAYVRRTGVLSKAFEWCGTDGLEQLSVEGELNSDDIALLKSSLPALAHLNLSKARLAGGQLAGNAFEGSSLVSFISPMTLSSAGGQLFRNCPRLAAVVWNANVRLLSNTFDGVDNPNLLLYVNRSTLNQTRVANVVIDGTAEKITLVDASTGNNNFYSPQAFTAKEISYTHYYQQRTTIGVTQGWETLALPFTVQSISHESHGALQPFYSEGDGKPFWLMELTEDGLKHTQTIEANKPYVISMPNNPSVYADIYNQSGLVTFSAQNAEVPATVEQAVSGAGVVLKPTFLQVPKSGEVYALNVNEAFDNQPEGSVFLPNYRDVLPFEAYATSVQAVRRYISIAELSRDDQTAVQEFMVTGTDGKFYNLQGLPVSKPTNGLYIKDGKKVMRSGK